MTIKVGKSQELLQGFVKGLGLAIFGNGLDLIRIRINSCSGNNITKELNRLSMEITLLFLNKELVL